MITETVKLEYKGYTTIISSERKQHELYAICEPGSNIPLDSWGFAADNIEEANLRFHLQVEAIIAHKTFKNRNDEWLANTDYESISDVLNIHPKKFRQRVLEGKFDESLLESVQGGDYAVPLYYVTKAWEEILKGKLDFLDFMVCSEEDGDKIIDDEELLVEEHATRRRSEAIVQNDEMKLLWKELFNIDLDNIEIDFTQFNMHMPPHISESDADYYFRNAIDGVSEWIPIRVNYEEADSITFDAVSCLMEFVAYIIIVVRAADCH